MKRLALVHKKWFAPSAVTDRWACLFGALVDECGFELDFIEDVDCIPGDAEVVLFSGAAKHFDSQRVLDLIRTCPAKRIIYLADYTPSHRGAAEAVRCCELVLAPELETYQKEFGDQRLEFFPYFFAPEKRYSELAWNPAPTNRCLVSGPVNHHYPLRQAAAGSSWADILTHTGSHGATKAGAVVRDAYALKLREYRCAVAGSLRGGITTKTFEILAAGALLITDSLPDMDAIGLRAFEHYVPATPGDILTKIEEVVLSPDGFEGTRRNGMVYARANHGLRNRVDRFKALVESL